MHCENKQCINVFLKIEMLLSIYMKIYKEKIKNIQFLIKQKQEMFKDDKIKRFLDCDLCNKLLIGPVVIPCGKVVCKSILIICRKTRNIFLIVKYMMF